MKKLYRRSISGLLALLICFTAILGRDVYKRQVICIPSHRSLCRAAGKHARKNHKRRAEGIGSPLMVGRLMKDVYKRQP